jgi:hypothetical protein
MTNKIKLVHIVLASLVSLFFVDSFRNVLGFDYQNAFAEVTVMSIPDGNGGEIVISTSQRNTSRTISIDQYCSDYCIDQSSFYSQLSNLNITDAVIGEVWCETVSDPNSFCNRNQVAAKLILSSGNWYQLPVIPINMDY